MKKLAILLCIIPGLAFASSHSDTGYGGFRIGGRNMGFKTNYGNKMFAKNFVQYSIFGGMNFTKYFGAELNFFTTNSSKRNATIVDGATELGVPDFSGLGNDSYSTSTQLYGTNLMATLRYPVMKHLNVFASAGIGYSQLKIDADMTVSDGLTPTQLQQTNNQISQKQSKVYPVIGAGVDWRFARDFGAKADIGWEGTQAFKMTFRTPAGSPNNYQVKANSSFIYGLSVYFVM